MLMTERESARTRAFYETVADGYARALDDVSVEAPIDLAVIADFAASIIHTPPHALPALFREFARVLRPGGMLLLGYQSGVGERVRSGAYGSDVELHAYLHHTPYVQAASAGAGLTVDTVLTRSPRRTERLPQGFVLARRS
jgi:SAM-dependent methyltransferase